MKIYIAFADYDYDTSTTLGAFQSFSGAESLVLKSIANMIDIGCLLCPPARRNEHYWHCNMGGGFHIEEVELLP